MGAKNLQNGAPTPLNRAQKAPREGQDNKKTEKEHRPNKKEGVTLQRTHILKEKVDNMAPSWLPKPTPNRSKIDANFDRNIDAFQDGVLKRFWWIRGGKMEACWHLKSMKKRYQLRKAILLDLHVFP